MADFQRTVMGSLSQRRSDIFVAVGVIAVIMMLVIPLPAFLLDTLMAFNLILSLLVILIVLYTQRALDFSIFPTLLLVLTVFGLALNVSSTRLILSQGPAFGGRLVRAFATFVVGSAGTEGLVIGIVIFTILIAVQFIVITKGSTRISEVAARFTLNALPGKQMAIEAEYNSGVITEEESARRKSDLQRETDFFGSMDGASKFVSGNIRAGILITLINMIGGTVIGMTLQGMSFGNAMTTYVQLTIGDGLVTQFPALLVSTATGLIVTRAVSTGTFGSDVTSQFTRYSRVYWIGAVFLFALSFVPGFPWFVLMPMAGMFAYLAYRLSRKEIAESERQTREEAAAKAPETPAEMSPVVPLDPLSLELGYGLFPLVDKDQGAELLDRITRIRRESALEIGLVLPRIRIIDNMRLEPSEYSFKIKGVEVGRGMIRIGHYLSINPGGVREDIPGEATIDPAFGLPALWITEEYRERAERAGYTVVNAPSIIATHLTEIIKRHAAEILGRQEVQSILDTLKRDYPAVVDEVVKALSLGEIQKVLQGLLSEQVSIRNMVAILETLADFGPITKDISFLIEKTRQSLSRQISLQYADESHVLRVLTLNPELEQRIIDSRVETASGYIAALEPSLHRKWITALTNSVHSVQEEGHFPLVLCTNAARPLVKSSTKRELPDLVVISFSEVVTDVRVESLGEVRL